MAVTPKKPRDKPRRPRGDESKSFFGLGFWAILIFVILMIAEIQLLALSRPQVDGRQLTYKTFV
ncbi:MAG: hypothetical protein H0V50_02185, partial [Thermoleophilaceae bacterium]|nr:hypothetical protein [Thermoleophilaceae bacterium]